MNELKKVLEKYNVVVIDQDFTPTEVNAAEFEGYTVRSERGDRFTKITANGVDDVFTRFEALIVDMKIFAEKNNGDIYNYDAMKTEAAINDFQSRFNEMMMIFVHVSMPSYYEKYMKMYIQARSII